LKAEYDKVKARYEMPETRSIRYIAVDVAPSKEDYAKVEAQINMLQEVFATTDDVAAVVDNNSDVPYEDVYVAISTMSDDMKAFVEAAKVGDATTPAFADEAYTMYRLMGTKTAPDTITVKIASFPMGDNTIDSVYNAVAAGAEFGADVNVMEEFAVTEDMYAGLGRNFVADVFAAGNGYFKTSSLGGVQHIAKVVKRSAPVAKAKVATLTIGVVPSVETETELYNNLSSYVAKYNTVEQFADSAFVAGYTTIPAECQAAQTSVAGIQNSRQMIHWAFNAKKGDVSEIYEIGDRYVVAMLEKVVKEGYRPMEELENLLNTNVRRAKKGEAIAQQLSAVSPATIEAYATAMNTKVDTVKFVSVASPSVAGIGYEPVVAGAAAGLEMGELSAPIAGNRGVYVLQVVNENAASRPYNEEAEMSRLEQQYMAVINQFVEVLKEKANIENTLVRFF
jgi:peptidyl-prolyl cis-trans isomerase D